MSSKEPPCKDCVDRSASCHGTCQRYKGWHEQHVQRQREIRSKIEAWNQTNAFYIESGMRIRKSRRMKK
jgi:hypothetical protein